MSQEPEFPFDRSRRVTPEEHQRFKTAIEQQLGVKLHDRNPVVQSDESYESVVLQLHPKILSWAREEAEKQGVAYQTVINAVLLQQVS
jgi:predicted DNA binding CopG/RHH family protein